MSTRHSGTQFLAIEDLLHTIVHESNKEVNGDGCSIFLLDEETGRYVLRESTVMTRFLHNFSLEITEEKDRQYKMYVDNKRDDPFKDERLKNIGLTVFSVLSGKSLIVPDVRKDVRWSNYGREEEKRGQEHCELSVDEVGSFLAISLYHPERKSVIGVIRVVRKQGSAPFTDKDTALLESYLNEHISAILNSRSLTDLIELGSILDLEELCKEVVITLRKIIVGGEGCSIFLLDEDTFKKGGKRLYRCVATTGLRDTKGERIPKKDAFYDFDKDDNTLTIWIIKNRQNCIIEDVTAYNYKKEFGLDRGTYGKYSEYFADNPEGWTGAVMIAPLFNRVGEAIGAIRITKPKGREGFKDNEVKMFLSFVGKLSKTIANIKYISLLNELARMSGAGDLKVILDLIVEGAQGLIGPYEISIRKIQRDEKGKEILMSLRDEKIKPKAWEIGQCIVGWVAKNKKPLRIDDVWDDKEFESKKINRNLFKEALKILKDEGNLPYKSHLEGIKSEIAVPLLIGERVLGVINMHSDKRASFSQRDENLLCSFAHYAAIALDNADRIAIKEWQEPKYKMLYEDVSSILLNEKDRARILYYFLTAITHRDGLGFNRAIFFEYDANKIFKGVVGKGPKGSSEAQNFIEKFDGGIVLSFKECILGYDNDNGRVWFGSEKLKASISSVELTCADHNCAIANYISRICSQKTYDAECMEISNLCGKNKGVLNELEITKFAISPVFVEGNLYGVIIVDNIYREDRSLDEKQLEVLRHFSSQLGLIMQNALILKEKQYLTEEEIRIYLGAYRNQGLLK